MTARSFLLGLATLSLIAAAIQATPVAADANHADPRWDAVEVAGGLDFPSTLVFGPDGTLYYAELNTGAIREIPPDASEPLDEPVATVDVAPGGNGGFLGLALAPDFRSSGVMYVYYTTHGDGGERVNHVSRLQDGGETVLFTTPFAEMHNGGRLLFVNGDLYVTTGDNEKRDPSQDPDDVRGKVLRVDEDGNAVPGNAWGDDNPAWVMGLRNPFGIAWDPDAERMWLTDNGPNCCDVVHVLEAGANYGWPHVIGAHDDARFKQPVAHYETPIGPTGADVLHGDLFFGEFNRGAVHRVTLNGDAATAEVVWETPYNGRVLDVATGPNDRLYVATYDKVYRLDPPGADPAPSLKVDLDDENGSGDDGDRVDDRDNERVGGGFRVPAPGIALVAVAFAAAVAATARRRS